MTSSSLVVLGYLFFDLNYKNLSHEKILIFILLFTMPFILIIGSNANYNWSDNSDIDLHVVVNYKAINHSIPLVTGYMQAKKSIWMSNYPLKYKNIPIELYAQDSNDNLHSTVGIYSVLNDVWIKKPNSEIISIDDDAITQKTESYEYEIDALSEKDPKLEFKIKDLSTDGFYTFNPRSYKIFLKII
jgi:hypothetical protein